MATRSEQQKSEIGSKILSPKVWVEGISNFLPKSGPSQGFLKLEQTLEPEDFNILLRKRDYDFNAENLEEFVALVRQATKGKPIITKDLFPFLSARGLDPLLIISKEDRFKFQLEKQDIEHQKALEKKEEEFNNLLWKFQEVQQKLHERDEQIQLQQQQINQLTQDNQELKQQNQKQQQQIDTLMEKMEAVDQFIASKAAA